MQHVARPPRYAVERQVHYLPRPDRGDLDRRASVLYHIWDRGCGVFLPGGFATPADATAHVPRPGEGACLRGETGTPHGARGGGRRRRALTPTDAE